MQLALGDVLTNAGTVVREAGKGGGRRTVVAWWVLGLGLRLGMTCCLGDIHRNGPLTLNTFPTYLAHTRIPLKYRDRLALALAAEALCALLASASSSSSSSSLPRAATTTTTTTTTTSSISISRGPSAASALSTTQQLQSQSSRFTKRRRLGGADDEEGGGTQQQEEDGRAHAARACLAQIREALAAFSPAAASGGGGGRGGLPSAASSSSAYLLDGSQAPAATGLLPGGGGASQAVAGFSQARHARAPSGGFFHSRGASSASLTQTSALPLGTSGGHHASGAGVGSSASAGAGAGAGAGRSAGAGLLQTLAHLQLLTALVETLPPGAEAWALAGAGAGAGVEGPGAAVAEWIALLEGVLAARSEGILTLWALAALLAFARRGLGLAFGPRQAGWVREAWRSVLATLLRRDLPCWGATGRPAAGGVGEVCE